MKKFLVLIIVLIFAVLLTSCVLTDSSFGEDDKTDIKQTEAETEAETKAETEVNEKDAPKELSRGKVENGVYKNEFLGFEFEIPSTWRCMSDEIMANSCGLTVEKFKNENFGELAKEKGSIKDFNCSEIENEAFVDVSYIYLATYKHISGLTVESTEEDVANGIKQMYESDGSTNLTMTTETVEISGNNYLRVICTFNGKPLGMEGSAYYLRKVGDYMAFIQVRVGRAYTVEDIESMIK